MHLIKKRIVSLIYQTVNGEAPQKNCPFFMAFLKPFKHQSVSVTLAGKNAEDKRLVEVVIEVKRLRKETDTYKAVILANGRSIVKDTYSLYNEARGILEDKGYDLGFI